MDVKNIDLDCKLISGKIVYVDNIPIYSVSLDTIFDIGYSYYNSILSQFCVSAELISKVKGSEIEDCDIFNFLFNNCKVHKDLLNDIMCFIIIFTRSEVLFNKKDNKFDIIQKDKIIGSIDNNNFLKIRNIIKKRNGISSTSEDCDNPANEKARQLILMRNKFRKKISDMKSNEDGSDITFSDLVGILSNGLHMEISQVCKYDIYQFNDQFNRLKMFKNYDVNIQALLAGAKKEDIHLVHWMSKISDKNESEDED